MNLGAKWLSEKKINFTPCKATFFLYVSDKKWCHSNLNPMNYLVTSEARLKLNNNLNERKSIIVYSRVYMLTEFFQRFFWIS